MANNKKKKIFKRLSFNEFIYCYADEIICVSLVVIAICSIILIVKNGKK